MKAAADVQPRHAGRTRPLLTRGYIARVTAVIWTCSVPKVNRARAKRREATPCLRDRSRDISREEERPQFREAITKSVRRSESEEDGTAN